MSKEPAGGGRKIAHIMTWVYPGPAEGYPQELATLFEADYDDEGREIIREWNGYRTFFRYDASGLLAEEETVCEDDVETKTYEYSPDGELVHTRTVRKILDVRKCYPVLPSGSIDVSSGMREYAGLVPTGFVEDEWISWERDGLVRVTHTRTTREDGTIEECTRRVFREEDVPDDEYEYDYDEEGNWIRCRRCDRTGDILMEIVREIYYL